MTGRPMLAIDPGATASPHSSVTLFREPSEILLPAVCEMIGADLGEAHAGHEPRTLSSEGR